MLDRTENRSLASAYDVIIIGSGMGASAAALRLAQAGRKVLMLERGRWEPRPQAGSANRFIFDQQSPEDDFEIVGGRSKYYGAALYRFREADFEETEYETGVSPAWPISYSDLERYYDEAEALYRVHGAPHGDPTDPHGDHAYPHPPLPDDPLIADVRSRLEACGNLTAHIPRGLDYGPGRACSLCHACSGHYCGADAKMDADIATLRPALETGNVELIADAQCLQILTDPHGRRAEGVLARICGVEQKIYGDQVIVAAGFRHSPALLRRSRTDSHPEGLGNGGGWLGKGVAAHSTGTIFPLIQLGRLGPRHTNTLSIHAWMSAGVEADWPFPLGIVQVAGQTPFWHLTSRLKRPLIKAVAERSLNVFHMTEALPDKATGWAFDGDTLGAFTPPRFQKGSFERLRSKTQQAFRKAGYQVITPRREVALWHETGGAIMGDDETGSVVDRNGRVHGLENVYVADASVMPSASAVNTGLTIVALALRTADATMA
ncbi:MAG: GMC family oxidoreductase [Pseudomonadota bacterium]